MDKFTYHGEDGGEHLNLLGERSGVVLPVHKKGCFAHEQREVELGVLLAETVVRPSAEHKIVLGALHLSITGVVPLGVKLVRPVVDLRVTQCHIRRGNNHGALGSRVGVGDGERLLDLVGNHDDRRTVTEELAHNSPGVGHRLKLVHVDSRVDITVADLQILLAHAIKDIRTLSHDLEQPSGGAAGGILRSEQEGEDGLGDLVVGEVTEKRVRLLKALDFITLLFRLAPPLGVDHLLNPGVHDASSLASSSHANLALGRALCELSQNHVGCLLAVPGLGVRDDDGEVDELESGGNQIVVVGDLLDSVVRDVVANKSAARDGGDDLAEVRHERLGLSTVGLGDIDELLEVAVVHLLLARKVDLERAASEQSVQTLAEVDVGLAIEEHPVVGAQKLVSDIDDARLNIGGGVEHLASHVTGRGDDNEPTHTTC